MALQFKVQLKNVTNPPVWRRVVVPDFCNFHDLHVIIQSVFPWDNSHLYMFNPKGYGTFPCISLPDEEWNTMDMNAKKTDLSKIFITEKQTFTYIYDFGDDWVHQITLEKILPDILIYPKCLAGKGTCPPEDCGGPWGYEHLKATLSDPSSDEYEEMMEWLGLEKGEKWDVNYFDPEDANEVLLSTFKKLKKSKRNNLQ